jgi:two-component system, NarL family, response regulator NreC
MINVVLADDHEVVRTGIKMLLEADPNIKVIDEAADGAQAYSLVAQHKPQIILLDISMPPGQSGLTACRNIATDFPGTRIIILTMFAEPEYLLYTLRGGASGYVLKNSSSQLLRRAVHDVANGGTFIDPSMADLLSKHTTETDGLSAPLQHLDAGDLEMLQLIARGFTNKEIAERMYLSVKTIESHRSKIYKKLNLKSRADAVEYAIKHRLLDL